MHRAVGIDCHYNFGRVRLNRSQAIIERIAFAALIRGLALNYSCATIAGDRRIRTAVLSVCSRHGSIAAASPSCQKPAHPLGARPPSNLSHASSSVAGCSYSADAAGSVGNRTRFEHTSAVAAGDAVDRGIGGHTGCSSLRCSLASGDRAGSCRASHSVCDCQRLGKIWAGDDSGQGAAGSSLLHALENSALLSGTGAASNPVGANRARSRYAQAVVLNDCRFDR